MTLHTIFIAFLCDNFSKISYFNIFPKFSNTSTGKMLFLKIFLSAPKYFRRHKDSQKRHSGAKAPQLSTLKMKTKQKSRNIQIFSHPTSLSVIKI